MRITTFIQVDPEYWSHPISSISSIYPKVEIINELIDEEDAKDGAEDSVADN